MQRTFDLLLGALLVLLAMWIFPDLGIKSTPSAWMLAIILPLIGTTFVLGQKKLGWFLVLVGILLTISFFVPDALLRLPEIRF